MPSKFLKDQSLSVGYNVTGQFFFDILKDFRPFIRDYFFSLTATFNVAVLDPTVVRTSLMQANTYGIPGNLVLNINEDVDECFRLLDFIYGYVDLSAVTVLNPAIAYRIKKKYPRLEVHASVRYFDWNMKKNPRELLDALGDEIDVVNLSDIRSFNDPEIFDEAHRRGMKTKFIFNEGCIYDRYTNWSQFPELKHLVCPERVPCEVVCSRACELVPWMQLARVYCYKEMIPMVDVDIWKLSTRQSGNVDILNQLKYMTNDSHTWEDPLYHADGLHGPLSRPIITPENKDVFLKWLDFKVHHCPGRCYYCRACEKFYQQLMEPLLPKEE